MKRDLYLLSGAALVVSAASSEAYVLATSIVGVAILVIQQWAARPAKALDERFDKQDKRSAAIEKRIAELEEWRNG